MIFSVFHLRTFGRWHPGMLRFVPGEMSETAAADSHPTRWQHTLSLDQWSTPLQTGIASLPGLCDTELHHRGRQWHCGDCGHLDRRPTGRWPPCNSRLFWHLYKLAPKPSPWPDLAADVLALPPPPGNPKAGRADEHRCAVVWNRMRGPWKSLLSRPGSAAAADGGWSGPMPAAFPVRLRFWHAVPKLPLWYR